MELKEDEKQCPICKMNIPKEALTCPYCRNDLSVGGNVAKIITTIGTLLIVFVTIPILLTTCGFCAIH